MVGSKQKEGQEILERERDRDSNCDCDCDFRRFIVKYSDLYCY